MQSTGLGATGPKWLTPIRPVQSANLASPHLISSHLNPLTLCCRYRAAIDNTEIKQRKQKGQSRSKDKIPFVILVYTLTSAYWLSVLQRELEGAQRVQIYPPSEFATIMTNEWSLCWPMPWRHRCTAWCGKSIFSDISVTFLYTPLRSWTWLYRQKANKTTFPIISCPYRNNVNFSHTSRIHFSAINTSFRPFKPMELSAHRQAHTDTQKWKQCILGGYKSSLYRWDSILRSCVIPWRLLRVFQRYRVSTECLRCCRRSSCSSEVVRQRPCTSFWRTEPRSCWVREPGGPPSRVAVQTPSERSRPLRLRWLCTAALWRSICQRPETPSFVVYWR